ncbi:cation diffusion facilitator family transporter [Propioniciclava soli]|uniref:Cation diffusion facilitator family transporter n=1 Tax=Propioniciclava soli TaxID=2775081 RepID=A0ABZ3C9F2_9ACTN|nr:cation diffusion facilitator family transporter [Propioniciclava soli]
MAHAASAQPLPATPVGGAFLLRFLYLSLATAVATVVIKGVAALLTGSVGLLSDALESTVNLVAAAVAIWALRLSDKPADHNHDFGHGKAEYMSALVEGALIFVAAAAIIATAIGRFIDPQPVESLGIGLLLSLGASVLNLVVGLVLVRQGKAHRSLTLEADGHHLLTDVWTSVGVLVGMGLLLLTGWHWVDPLVALVVGLNILLTGSRLLRRSTVGLLDAALPAEEVAIIRTSLDEAMADDPRVIVTELLTRESGRQRFVQVTAVVPGHWTVQRSHDLADEIELAVARALPETVTVVHLEPGPSDLPTAAGPTDPDHPSI